MTRATRKRGREEDAGAGPSAQTTGRGNGAGAGSSRNRKRQRDITGAGQSTDPALDRLDEHQQVVLDLLRESIESKDQLELEVLVDGEWVRGTWAVKATRDLHAALCSEEEGDSNRGRKLVRRSRGVRERED